MGLTKQYLRYAASAVFGVIGSQKANISYVTLRGGERGRYVAVAACEHVFIWDIRKAEKVRRRCDYDSSVKDRTGVGQKPQSVATLGTPPNSDYL